MVIGECTDAFRGTFSRWSGGGSGKGVMWEDLSIKEFMIREEHFHEGGRRIF